MQINKTTSHILSDFTVDKSQLSIFIKYEMRVWCGLWWIGRGRRYRGDGDTKEYLSELRSTLNKIKKPDENK